MNFEEVKIINEITMDQWREQRRSQEGTPNSGYGEGIGGYNVNSKINNNSEQRVKQKKYTNVICGDIVNFVKASRNKTGDLKQLFQKLKADISEGSKKGVILSKQFVSFIDRANPMEPDFDKFLIKRIPEIRRQNQVNGTKDGMIDDVFNGSGLYKTFAASGNEQEQKMFNDKLDSIYDELRGVKKVATPNMSRMSEERKFAIGKLNAPDLKDSPIEGCVSIKKLVEKWANENKPKSGQIEIVYRPNPGAIKDNGIAKVILCINGKYYQAPRGVLFSVSKGGVATNRSPYFGYFVPTKLVDKNKHKEILRKIACSSMVNFLNSEYNVYKKGGR